MVVRTIALAMTALGLSILPASATLVISGKPTSNVACSGGVCTATARKAVLNAGDLQAMLASGDVSVVSGRKARDIDVHVAISWASMHKLTLDAFNSIAVDDSIAVQGGGGLTLTTSHGEAGGRLFLGPKVSIDFLDTSSALIIDGDAYALVNDLATLGADVNGNPDGHYALARDYNAGPDGVYTDNPVSPFPGSFNGLGHTIKNLTIANSERGVHVGMFYQVGNVSHFHLVNVHVRAKATNVTVGTVAGACGSVSDVSVTGAVSGVPASFVGGVCGELDGNMNTTHSSATVTGSGGTQKALGLLGGLVGFADGGAVSQSYATGKVTGGKGWVAGGLVGETQVSDLEITSCYATGVVSVGDGGVAGGLIGDHEGQGTIDNSYATGFVGGGLNSTVGGFAGINDGPILDSYSSGDVASGSGNAVGGLVGNDLEANDLTNTYWDTTTSGQSHGVGNNTAYPGVTGLTTEQFQAGLPDGFDPGTWAENADVNGGLPYLVELPPS